MTYYQAYLTLPPDQLARLLLCPNTTDRSKNPIPCTQGTPAHTTCDACIARFLQTEVPEDD